MGYSLQGSSVHGIFQTRILEWLPFPSPGDLPNPGIEPVYPASPALAGKFFATEPPNRETLFIGKRLLTVFGIQQNHRLCKVLGKLDNIGDRYFALASYRLIF